MNMFFNQTISIGMIVRGKWNGQRYRIRRMLGKGANGIVFLVEKDGRLYAMKWGAEALDMQSEINVLRKLSQTQGTSLESYFIEADDADWQGRIVPFYIMKYIEGESLDRWWPKKSRVDQYTAGWRLLSQLQLIHENGYVFGDLKPENMLVAKGGEVHLIDFGGVTPQGRAVKQFTEVFDRGYWRAGHRTADPAFDLFSFALIWISLLAKPGQISEIPLQNRSAATLYDIIRSNSRFNGWLPFLSQALHGELKSVAEAKALWLSLPRLPRWSSSWSSVKVDRILAGTLVGSLALCVYSLWLAFGG